MLSLIRIGMPCNGPRTRPSLRSRSSAAAIASASGLSSMTDFIVGPRLSISLMRSVYFSTSDRAEYLPDCIPRCRSAMVSSSSSKAGGGVNAAVGLVTATASAVAVVCRKFLRFMRPLYARVLAWSDFERVEEPVGAHWIFLVLGITDNDLIRPAAHHVNPRLENSVSRLGDKLERLVAVDLHRTSADECRLDAFYEVVAVGSEFAYPVEVKTRIVVDPADEIDVRIVTDDEQVGRVWTMLARGRF